MDTKTPEQLAVDYAYSQSPRSGPEDIIWRICRDDFLAAYEAAKPKWISVHVEKPTEKPVLLALSNGFVTIARYDQANSRWISHPIEVLGVYCPLYEQNGASYPTHWMPLPAPPKEEG